MSRSELLGEPRRSVTEYVYDDDGRLVRAVTTHQARFSDDDTEGALQRAEARATTCPGCGMPSHEVSAEGLTSQEAIDIDSALQVDTYECLGCGRLDRWSKSNQTAPSVHPYVKWRDDR